MTFNMLMITLKERCELLKVPFSDELMDQLINIMNNKYGSIKIKHGSDYWEGIRLLTPYEEYQRRRRFS